MNEIPDSSILSCNYRFKSVITESFANMDVTKDIKKAINTEMNGQLKNVEDIILTSLISPKELAESQEQRGRLEEKLRASENTARQLKLREEELTEQVNSLKYNLAKSEKAIEDISLKNSGEEVPTMSEVQIQLQTTSVALTEALESLKDKEAQINTLNQSLLEERQSAENTKERLKQMELERTTLTDKVQHAEARVREELGRASVISRDQIKAQFEQRFHQMQKEKTALQKNVEKLGQAINELKVSMVGLTSEIVRKLLTTTRLNPKRSLT